MKTKIVLVILALLFSSGCNSYRKLTGTERDDKQNQINCDDPHNAANKACIVSSGV